METGIGRLVIQPVPEMRDGESVVLDVAVVGGDHFIFVLY